MLGGEQIPPFENCDITASLLYVIYFLLGKVHSHLKIFFQTIGQRMDISFDPIKPLVVIFPTDINIHLCKDV